jgi:hypothetical protein
MVGEIYEGEWFLGAAVIRHSPRHPLSSSFRLRPAISSRPFSRQQNVGPCFALHPGQRNKFHMQEIVSPIGPDYVVFQSITLWNFPAIQSTVSIAQPRPWEASLCYFTILLSGSCAICEAPQHRPHPLIVAGRASFVRKGVALIVNTEKPNM